MLKRFFVYILLMVMSFRPAYFIGVVAYYETHINEIVEKYCVNKELPQLKCNGQCHLAKQLKATQNTDSDQEAMLDVSFAFYPVFYQNISNTSIAILKYSNSNNNFLYSESYQFLESYSFFKPPIV